jgi:glycosyltransferase involved in cell wall biosynthesis
MPSILNPVLSILIPTFNRAPILRLTLNHLLSEVRKLEGLVEVVIGDNASTDETDTVLKELSNEYSRTIRRDSNIGAWRNIVALASEARGDWVWILGDDDFLVPDRLSNLIATLNCSPDLDLIFVNYGWIETSRLQACLEKGETIQLSDECQWRISEDIDFKNGPEIFELPSPFPAGSFSALFGFLVRNNAFTKHAKYVKPGALTDGFNEFEFSLEDAFPHSIVALEIVGKQPAKLISDVCVLQGVGGWGWKRFLYRTTILGLFWLFLRYDSVIPKSAWLSLASYAGTRLARMLHNPDLNFGFADIEKAAVPTLMLWPDFESSFTSECDRIGILSEGMASLGKWKENRRKN